MSLITLGVEQEKGANYLLDDDKQPKLRSFIVEKIKAVEISGTGSLLRVDTGGFPLEAVNVAENTGAMAAYLE